jgi:hypothetical protein
VGLLVQQLGDVAGFVSMAAATTAGAGLLWVFLPETKPRNTSIDVLQSDVACTSTKTMIRRKRNFTAR